jgi:hypothetical protein
MGSRRPQLRWIKTQKVTVTISRLCCLSENKNLLVNLKLRGEQHDIADLNKVWNFLMLTTDDANW